MLDRGADARQAPVTCALGLGQRAVSRAPLIDVERDPVGFRAGLECLGVVRRIPMQALLFTVQQLAQHADVGHVRRGGAHGMHQSGVGVGTGRARGATKVSDFASHASMALISPMDVGPHAGE